MSGERRRRPRGRVRGAEGFALIGVMAIILALTAMAVGVLVVSRYLEAAITHEEETRALIQRVTAALRGDGETTFGYVGDMGELPLSLPALLEAESPAFHRNTSLKVGMGWNGPYLPEERFPGDEGAGGGGPRARPLKDAWGRPLVYDKTLSGGVVTTAVIRSKGADGAEKTADDIVSETIHARGTLRLYVWKDTQKTIDQTTVVKLYRSNRGAEGFVTGTRVQGGVEDYMTFPAVHAGAHAVQLLKDGQFERMVAIIRVHGGVETIIKLGYTD